MFFVASFICFLVVLGQFCGKTRIYSREQEKEDEAKMTKVIHERCDYDYSTMVRSKYSKSG